MGFERPAVMRFDLPFQADAPSLLSDAIGITGLMERCAASHGFDVTVLDSADDRLLHITDFSCIFKTLCLFRCTIIKLTIVISVRS